jgi:hypothetical protein
MKTRVILKKTSYLKRQERGNSKRISKYLEKYVDEVGKAIAKNGEAPWIRERLQNSQTQEPRWLLPQERTGVFYTGGFLGEGESPGNSEANKQKGWIRRFTTNWVKALEKNNTRRNDGFRFILGLSPQTVKELTACGISCDQAMREIWCTTVSLYRERHGWTSPQDDIAWLAGAHHDTDNAHMHIMLFPTTKSGKILRTNNSRGKERINDLNDLIAMSNIATEIYYREYMPFKYQSSEFKSELMQSPEQEPRIPDLEEFEIPSGIAGDKFRKQKDEEEENISWEDIKPLDSKRKDEIAQEYGVVSFINKIRKRVEGIRGRLILGAIATIAKVWEKKKLKFFPTIKSLNNPTEGKQILEKIQDTFPEEEDAMKRLEIVRDLEIISREKTRLRLNKIIENDQERGHTIINMAIGLRENITDTEAQKIAPTLLANFEAGIKASDNSKKLELVEQEGLRSLNEKKKEDSRRLEYQSIRRSLKVNLKEEPSKGESILKAIEILNQMIEGSKKVSLSLEARYLEAKYSIEKTEKGLQVKNEDREWDLENAAQSYKLIVRSNKGKPWPPHLDPDTVILPLEAPTGEKIENKTIRKRGEPQGEEARTEKLNEEDTNPLEIIIKSKTRRNRERRAQIKKRLRETGRPSLDGDGEDIEEREIN